MFLKVRTDLSILTRTNVCTFYIKFHTFNITIISKVFYLTRLFIHTRAFVGANRVKIFTLVYVPLHCSIFFLAEFL